MLKLNRIIETALYADDLDRARRFYGDILALKPIFETETLSAYDVGGQTVLLLFKRGGSVKTQVFAGGSGAPKGEIPPHDGNGPVHMCFAIDADQFGMWEARLNEKGIPIEGRTQWARGGESVYFRDPDGHLLELMTLATGRFIRATTFPHCRHPRWRRRFPGARHELGRRSSHQQSWFAPHFCDFRKAKRQIRTRNSEPSAHC